MARIVVNHQHDRLFLSSNTCTGKHWRCENSKQKNPHQPLQKKSHCALNFHLWLCPCLLLEPPPVSPSTVQTSPADLTSERCRSLQLPQEVASLPFCVKSQCLFHHINTVKEIHVHVHQAPRTSAMLCIKKLSPIEILICSCNCH